MPNMDYYNEKLAQLDSVEKEQDRSDVVKRKAVSNLFFDDNSALEYLAEQRFPGDPTAPFRYKYIDGELVYEDEDGNYVPEFEGLEDATVFEDYFYPNIIPATTIAADIGGGMYGAGKGFEKGLKLAQASPAKTSFSTSCNCFGKHSFRRFWRKLGRWWCCKRWKGGSA